MIQITVKELINLSISKMNSLFTMQNNTNENPPNGFFDDHNMIQGALLKKLSYIENCIDEHFIGNKQIVVYDHSSTELPPENSFIHTLLFHLQTEFSQVFFLIGTYI